MRRFFAKLTNLFRHSQAESDLVREIDSHLSLMRDDLERRGLSPEEAKLAARRAYGGVEQIKELHRDARSFPWLEQWFRDIRYGARSLLRAPGFTAIAVLTLALGIGANTAIFSVVNAVLLRPLEYRDADRLITLLHDGTDPVAPANYLDWREQAHSFQDVAAAENWSSNLTGIEAPEHIPGMRVSQNLLPMLGVPPLLGRLFAVGEDQKGSDHEVILSHRLWMRQFTGDRGVLGKPILLNGEPYTIVGVMPPAFKFAPFWATHSEMWAPLAFGDQIHSRRGNSLRIFARLKDGVSIAHAQAEIATIAKRLEQQYPGTNRNVLVTPLKENVVGKVQTPLLIVLGSVVFVLLIACANVAHMSLARASDRQKEIAVRAALGAGKSRLIVQFLTESLLLSVLGASAGFALAFFGIKSLAGAGGADVPRLDMVNLDLKVMSFLLLVTVLTSVAFGLAPALQAASDAFGGALKEGGRGGSDGLRGTRIRSLLVASEFALAFMLLIGAGLMIRSFFALQAVNPGFNPHNVLSMVVSVAGTKQAEPHQRAVFYDEMLRKVGAVPGVQSAGAINHLPLAGDMWGLSFIIEGRPKPLPGQSPVGVYRVIMPGYSRTMQLRMLNGREIDKTDNAAAPGVLVINERAAQAYWPGENPLGKRIAFDAQKSEPPAWLTVVGVVKNVKQLDWAAVPSPEIYLSALQSKEFMGDGDSHTAYLTLVVRASQNAPDLAPSIKQAIWSLDRNVPISEVLSMDHVVADATAQTRFEMLLLGAFAAVALVLAAVGIYGVMTYAVSRRRREIGIRISLGASRAKVLRMLLQQGLLQAFTGAAAGLLGAFLLSKFMAKMLYEVQPADPLTYAVIVAVLGSSAILAICLPARRAIRIDPAVALRSE